MTALPPRPATLNRLVAERVMGFDPVCKGPLRLTDNDRDGYRHYYCRECLVNITITLEYFAEHGLPESHQRNCPAYSTDLNAAWKAVGKFTELPETFDVSSQMRLSRLAFWRKQQRLFA